jgi:tape measure domain-containing protein
MAIGKLLLKLGIDTTNLDKELGKVEKSMTKFGNTMKNVGSNLTTSLTLPIIGLGAASLKAFAEMEKLEKGMTAIMGSSQLAKDEIVKLREVAKLPGLGLKEAVQGSVNLQAVGLSAEEARNTLMGFGKALAATGKGKFELEAIQYQLTQMISKNKLLAEDYKVIQSNLPLMAEGMKAAFGTANMDLIRETGISAKDFTLQLSNALALLPQTQNVTGGLANSFENLSDNIFISLDMIPKIYSYPQDNFTCLFIKISELIIILFSPFVDFILKLI